MGERGDEPGSKVISVDYVQRDREAAALIYRRLKDAGVVVWMDDGDLQPRQEWEATISKAIHCCDILVSVVSLQREEMMHGEPERGVRREWKALIERLWSGENLRPLPFLLMIDRSTPADFPAMRGDLESHLRGRLVWRFLPALFGRLSDEVVRELQVSIQRDRFRRAFVCSGHLIDAPNRLVPRFPAWREAEVRVRIEQQLDEWKAGAGDLAVCGVARGADILFAEACQRRGMHVRLLIALEEKDYIEQSVALPGDAAWVERFHKLKHDAQEVWFQPERLGPPPQGLDWFSRCNLWILHSTLAEVASDRLYGLLVWDEMSTGDGPGGTSHFAGEIERAGGKVSIINPTPLPPA